MEKEGEEECRRSIESSTCCAAIKYRSVLLIRCTKGCDPSVRSNLLNVHMLTCAVQLKLVSFEFSSISIMQLFLSLLLCTTYPATAAALPWRSLSAEGKKLYSWDDFKAEHTKQCKDGRCIREWGEGEARGKGGSADNCSP